MLYTWFCLAGNNRVFGQNNLTSGVFCLGQECRGLIYEIIFTQAISYLIALGLEKGVGHGTTDEYAVNLIEQILNHTYFVRDFRAS